MIKIKLFAAFCVLGLATIIFSVSPVFISKAESDPILQEIAQYKNWQQINREPIYSGFPTDGVKGSENTFIIDGQEVTNFRIGTLNGWNSLPFNLLSSRSKKNQDVAQIVLQFGKNLKSLFASSKNSSAKNESQTPVKKAEIELLPVNNHQFSFGMVYANNLAKVEFEKEKPNFPVGSIIIREKNAHALSQIPQTVIAMVKRDKDFSIETGDWEFFVFNGADLKMQSRATKSDCSKCHVQAEKTDWVFRDYLK